MSKSVLVAMKISVLSVLGIVTATSALVPTKIRVPPNLALSPPAQPSPFWPSLQQIFRVEAELEIDKQLSVDYDQQQGLCGVLRDDLDAAGFRLLQPHDEALHAALNAGYLLRLNTNITSRELGRLSPIATSLGYVGNQPLLYDGRVLAFARGYDTERFEGRLTRQKLEYLLERGLANLREHVPSLPSWFGRYQASASAASLAPFLALDPAADEVADDVDVNVTLPAVGSGLGEAQLIDRVSIDSVFGRRRTLFSQMELREPTYKELVVAWQPEPTVPLRDRWLKKRRQLQSKLAAKVSGGLKRGANKVLRRPPAPPALTVTAGSGSTAAYLASTVMVSREAPPPPLELRVYADVPLANFAACLPGSKLVFRPADALRLDLLALGSLLALFVTRRLLSNSAEAIARRRWPVLAAIPVGYWLFRTVFSYSNALARYDLATAKFRTTKMAVRSSAMDTRPVYRYLAREAAVQRARRLEMLLGWMLQQRGAAEAAAGASRPVITQRQIDDAAPQMAQAFAAEARVLTTAQLREAVTELRRLRLVEDFVDQERPDEDALVLVDNARLAEALQAHWATLLPRG